MTSNYNSKLVLEQNKLIQAHLSLVKKIAQHLISQLPSSIQLEDLTQAGMLGLIEAAKNFQDDKGASFATYASIRIRGAMIDELRRGDWVPRSVHRNARWIASAAQSLENDLGRKARSSEISQFLDISVDKYYEILVSINLIKLFSFEEIQDNFQPETGVNSLEDAHFSAYLSRQIALLPERERQVLSLYYGQDLNLKNIGKKLGVSESRICQIHAEAMEKLKRALEPHSSE